jgi:hypothetical protein
MPAPPGVQPLPDITRLTDPVFANAYRASGLPGKPPPVFSDPFIARRGSAGEQELYNRAVHLTPAMVDAIRHYSLSPVGRNRDALRVLLHEYAHVNQPRVFNRLSAKAGIEPAADLWALNNFDRVARRIGGPELSTGQEFLPSYEGLGYPREVNAMTRRRDWPQFVQKGQFGQPVTGVKTMPPLPPRRQLAQIPTLSQYLSEVKRDRDRSGTRH